jgi:hypothetical protein
VLRFLADDPPVQGLRVPTFDVAFEGFARRKALAAEVAAVVAVWCHGWNYLGFDTISFAVGGVAVCEFARDGNRDTSLSASSS